MTGNSAAHQPGADVVICPACGGVAYCLDDAVVIPPCPHGTGLCGDHNIEGCLDCRLEAEREMCRSGVYDPRADPLHRVTGEEVTEIDVADWLKEVDDRAKVRGFDPATNSYRRRDR